MMRNIETIPSKQMYPYLSLVERKVAEFIIIKIEGAYWFGQNDLFSSLFSDNSWCQVIWNDKTTSRYEHL